MNISYKNPWLIGGIILVIVSGIYWHRSRSEQPAEEQVTAPVESGTLITSISASGALTAKVRADITTPTYGRIESLSIKDNEEVTVGQPLFRFKSLASATDVAKAYAALLSDISAATTAQQKLQDAHKNEAITATDLASKQLTYDKSKIEANKTITDARQDVIDAASTQAAADTDLEVVSAETGSKSANIALKAAKITAEEDVKKADKVLQEAQRDKDAAALKTKSAQQTQNADQASLTASRLAYQALSNQTVTAPVAGRVVNMSLVAGATVGRSQTGSQGANDAGSSTLFSIVDFNSLRAVVAVNEVDITKISIDQPATLTFDALPPEKTFTGTVVNVDTLGTTIQGVTTYDVEIELDTIDEDLRPGMTVSAAIITQRKDNALLIPNSAIRTEGGQTVVDVVRNGQTETVLVELGDTNDIQTDIVGGLAPGDEVITSRPQANRETSSFGGGFGRGGRSGSFRGGGGFGGLH